MYTVNVFSHANPETANRVITFSVEKREGNITTLVDYIALTEIDFGGKVVRNNGVIYKNIEQAIRTAKRRIRCLYGVKEITIKCA